MSPHRKIAASLAVLAVVLAFILAVAFGERSLRRWVALIHSPVGAAQWIWAPRIGEREGPLAFYAVRDFDLEEAPASARLLCLADESYLAFVNGELVGSGSYRKGAPLDAYDVTSLLRPGPNRLTFELRSSRGIGALLASLELGESGALGEIGTDGDWRVYWRYRREIFNLEPLDGGAVVRTWGPPPSGRWQTPPSIRDLPPASVLTSGRDPISPIRAWIWNGEWKLLPIRQQRRSTRPVGSMLMFEWSPPVTGYVNIHQRTQRPKPALLFAGLEVPVPDEQAPDGHIVLAPGRSGWRESVPRQIRYVLVVGADAPLAVVVEPVDRGRASALLAPVGPSGVFGLEPPMLRTPMEDEVWRQVEGFPGEAGREEL